MERDGSLKKKIRERTDVRKNRIQKKRKGKKDASNINMGKPKERK